MARLRRIEAGGSKIMKHIKSFELKGSTKFFYDTTMSLCSEGLLSNLLEGLLRQTPFHYILDLPYLGLNRSFLQELLNQYDDNEGIFVISGCRLPFKSDDIALIFGLPKHGRIIRLNSCPNKTFCDRIFEKGAVRRYNVVTQLRRFAAVQTIEGTETFVVLLIGLFVGTVLIPSCNVNISSGLWYYIEKLKYVGVYAWPSLIYQELLNEIRRARRQMIEDEDKGASSHSYGGCFLALQILGLGQADREGCSPRILGWGRDGMKGISKKLSRLQPANIKPSLAPLQCELHLLDGRILATPYRVLGGLALHSGPSFDATLNDGPDPGHKKQPRSAVDMRVEISSSNPGEVDQQT